MDSDNVIDNIFFDFRGTSTYLYFFQDENNSRLTCYKNTIALIFAHFDFLFFIIHFLIHKELELVLNFLENIKLIRCITFSVKDYCSLRMLNIFVRKFP